MERDHYSDKGSHKARSEYWAQVRRVTPLNEPIVKVEASRLIRRTMLRSTRSGKK